MRINKTIFYLLGLLLCSQIQANIQSHFDQIKKDPNDLYEFLRRMPKGGELHYHLSGGPYPETLLALASKGNYCMNEKTFTITSNTGFCDGITTKELINKPELYAQTVRQWSLKEFVPGVESAHEHFFNAFFKFGSLVFDYRPQLVAEVIKRAAYQQEEYLEIMILPDNAHSLPFGALIKNSPSFEQKRTLLLANKAFQKNIEQTTSETEHIFKQARHNLGCDLHPQDKNCQITLKFLYYSLREQPFNQFFAQTLNAFEAVAKSQKQGGSLVGVNLVQAENGMRSLSDYRKQMKLYEYLHQLYPQVNISLHAGELTQELVPLEELNYHIHDALMTGQAQRIGHGVDIAHEQDAKTILNYMAQQHKPVEINLVSNQKLLNVSGINHPLNYYLAHHVPVVFSTDDEGIFRTDLTSQYVEAVITHGLDYPVIKQINRNALTYAFAPGKSIWSDADKAQLISECKDLQSASCKQFIKTNEKAQLQWNLEQKLSAFEQEVLGQK
jgi:adenosine deaminase